MVEEIPIGGFVKIRAPDGSTYSYLNGYVGKLIEVNQESKYPYLIQIDDILYKFTREELLYEVT